MAVVASGDVFVDGGRRFGASIGSAVGVGTNRRTPGLTKIEVMFKN